MANFFQPKSGQEKIQEQLIHLLEEQRLPHTLLLSGESPEDTLTLAISIASTLVGREVFLSDGKFYLEERKEALLESGHKVSAEGEPLYIDRGEVFWMRPMTSTGLKIAQWQLLLHEYLTTYSEKPRVVIIEDFQTAREDFANALLKSIEEPPSGVYFMLLTTKKAAILPTILSRAMQIAVPAQELEVTEEEWQQICHFFDILWKSKNSFTEAVLFLAPLEKEQLLRFLVLIRRFLRDMEVIRAGGDDSLLLEPSLRYHYANYVSIISTQGISRLTVSLLEAESALRLHIRPNLVADGLVLAWRRIMKEERQ